MYIILLYQNKITSEIYTYYVDFLELNNNNIDYLLNKKKINLGLNQLSQKKYNNEDNIIMNYLGYLVINDTDIINIEESNDIYIDEIYIKVSYKELIKYSKKNSLLYKFKLLNNSIFNNLNKNNIEKILYILLKKYYKLSNKNIKLILNKYLYNNIVII